MGERQVRHEELEYFMAETSINCAQLIFAVQKEA
jgi:hypothetical protein